MTLFEKIYWTLFVINCVLGLIAMFLAIFDYDEYCWIAEPLLFQILLTIGYLILKLILSIWGIHIELFPSI